MMVKRVKRSMHPATYALTASDFPPYNVSDPAAMYMTAQLSERDVGMEFTIGDGKEYNNYRNQRLVEGETYNIYYGVEVTRGGVRMHGTVSSNC